MKNKKEKKPKSSQLLIEEIKTAIKQRMDKKGLKNFLKEIFLILFTVFIVVILIHLLKIGFYSFTYSTLLFITTLFVVVILTAWTEKRFKKDRLRTALFYAAVLFLLETVLIIFFKL
jgi:Flp pilus assembly protein TadB